MATLTPTTELEAVNRVLTNVGLSPISSLETSGQVDVTLAKSTLHEISRKVQSEGWYWNTEFDYPITLDGNGKATVPAAALRIDANRRHGSIQVIRRGDYLYDLYNHTYDLSDEVGTTIYVDLIWFFDFEDLPESAREYITIRAARRFQEKYLASDEHGNLTEDDENVARATLESEECDTGDYNVFRGSASTLEIVVRDKFLG